MKKIYLFFLILLFASSYAQIVNIPDANFKAKLLAANTTNNIAFDSNNISIVVDTNGDSEIQNSEALVVYKLSILGQPGGVISDLTGINSFTNLRSFLASSNALTTLSISGLAYLSSIQVVNNQLTTLSVSNLPSLQNIHVPNNQLSNYSIINCPNLQTLTLNNNLITSVNISDFPNLLTLQCDNNLISSITLNNNIGLKNIVANNNQLSDISFFEAPNLENLYRSEERRVGKVCSQ